MSFEEVGLSLEVAEVGLWAEVTPVLSVSCSGRMGPVAGVLPVSGAAARDEESRPVEEGVDSRPVEVEAGSVVAVVAVVGSVGRHL